jgi:hypothetical protein
MAEQFISFRYLDDYVDAYDKLPDKTKVAGFPEISPFETLGEYRSYQRKCKDMQQHNGRKTYLPEELAGGWTN